MDSSTRLDDRPGRRREDDTRGPEGEDRCSRLHRAKPDGVRSLISAPGDDWRSGAKTGGLGGRRRDEAGDLGALERLG